MTEMTPGRSGKAGFHCESVTGGVRIRIPTPRNWFVLIVLPFWLCGWAFGEGAMIWRLADIFRSGGAPDALLYVWLGGWTLAGLFGGILLLWFLFGVEVIEVLGPTLTIAQKIGPLARKKTFDITQIKDLRLAPLDGDAQSGMSSFALKGYGLLAFDHGIVTHRFGAVADEEAALQLLQLLRKASSSGLQASS